jgi:glycosyltransferase involved in cell wall biosynthesis
MKNVLLINQNRTPHYRIGVYNYLSAYLRNMNFGLTVVSEGIQEGANQIVEYDHKCVPLNIFSLRKVINDANPDVIIYWINLKNMYLFPLLLWLKLTNRKIIYWGHGIDLLGNKLMWLKMIAYGFEHFISDAIILYGDHLKTNIYKTFHNKLFVANNTLNFNNYQFKHTNKDEVLSKYQINTKRNIICMGRMQKRKRLDHLFKAFLSLDLDDVGLIFVGPDDEGVLNAIKGKNIYKIPPIYGNERLDLLSASDIFCIPGAIGLSIVDAFYCGLPVVTEEGDLSPEIMYLKDGINGFVVPRSDIMQLAERLLLLINDNDIREQFALAAREEIGTNGHMDAMCKGFSDALKYVCSQ